MPNSDIDGIVYKDGSSLYIVVTIIILIGLLIFISWTYILYGTPNIIANTSLYLQCAPGTCATDIKSGEKRCPEGDETSVIFSPDREACNPKYSCTSSRTKFALTSDGSTNEFGICDEGIICRCINQRRCSTYSLVLFQAADGQTFETIEKNPRGLIDQISNINSNEVGITTIEYADPLSQSCLLNARHLNRLAPGNCATNSKTMNPSSIELCLSQRNPCIMGKLAVVNVSDVASWRPTDQNLINAIVACVPGAPDDCPNKIPLWDSENGRLICVNTS